MNEETCYICKEPIGDIGGTIDMDGHMICEKCGKKALDLPEDTEIFVPYEENDDDPGDNANEEDGQDTEDEVEGDSEHRIMDDGNPAVIIREEPDVPVHIVRIPINSEQESVERIGPVESSEQPKESEDPVNEESEPMKEEQEGKKGFLSILLQKIQQLKQNIGKSGNRTVPRRKPEAKKSKRSEDPDPDSLKERWRRSKLIRNEGYVILKTLSRDSYGEYLLETTLVKAEDLPRDAVAVTNEKNTYCLDKIKTSRWYLETHIDPYADYYESQFNASDAALYMTSNKIDNALAIKWTEYSHIDFKRYMWLAIAALVVIVILIMRMR